MKRDRMAGILAEIAAQAASYEASNEHTPYVDIVGDEISDSSKDEAFIRDVLHLVSQVSA